jgi:hypothetical protein
MSTPEFKAALARYSHLSKTLGHDHDITKQAFAVVFHLAPEEFVLEVHKTAVEMNLVPEIRGYLEDGTPMYSLNDIAAKHGISIEEAERTMNEMLASRKAAGLPSDNLIVDSHKIHFRQ